LRFCFRLRRPYGRRAFPHLLSECVCSDRLIHLSLFRAAPPSRCFSFHYLSALFLPGLNQNISLISSQTTRNCRQRRSLGLSLTSPTSASAARYTRSRFLPAYEVCARFLTPFILPPPKPPPIRLVPVRIPPNPCWSVHPNWPLLRSLAVPLPSFGLSLQHLNLYRFSCFLLNVFQCCSPTVPFFCLSHYDTELVGLTHHNSALTVHTFRDPTTGSLAVLLSPADTVDSLVNYHSVVLLVTPRLLR